MAIGRQVRFARAIPSPASILAMSLTGQIEAHTANKRLCCRQTCCPAGRCVMSVLIEQQTVDLIAVDALIAPMKWSEMPQYRRAYSLATTALPRQMMCVHAKRAIQMSSVEPPVSVMRSDLPRWSRSSMNPVNGLMDLASEASCKAVRILSRYCPADFGAVCRHAAAQQR